MKPENLIYSPAENRIAKEFFKGFTNSTLVKKKLEYKTKYKSTGTINKVIGKWKRRGYMWESYLPHKKKGNIEYFARIKKFALNLNFIFDYLKNKNIKLTQKEKNYLNLMFADAHTRVAVCEMFRDDTLAEAFLKFYAKFLVLPYALKEDYVKGIKKIKNDKIFAENYEKYLQKNPIDRKIIKETEKNAVKISNTKKMEKLCVTLLGRDIERGDSYKTIKKEYREFIEKALRPLHAHDREDIKRVDFLFNLDKKLLSALGIYNV